MSFKLGLSGFEQPIPSPSGFNRTPLILAREDRTASGRKVKDIIAKKYSFTLTYPALTPAQAAVFLQEFARNQFLSFIYEYGDVLYTTTVDITSLPEELVLAAVERYAISITLEEV